MKRVLLSLFAAYASAHDFTTCIDDDKMGVQEIDVTPDPVIVGGELSVAIKGNSKIELNGGTAHLHVKALGVQVASIDFDVCKDLGVTCPIAPGPWEGKITYKVPGEAPGTCTHDLPFVALLFGIRQKATLECICLGGITADCTIETSDPNGDKVSCTELKIKLKREHMPDLQEDFSINVCTPLIHPIATVRLAR